MAEPHRRTAGLFRAAVLSGAILLPVIIVSWMTAMPGSSVKGPLPEPTAAERRLAERLEADVRALADGIGERNMHRDGSLAEAATWIEDRMREAGYRPERRAYELTGASVMQYAGRSADNLVAELPGTERPDEIVVIGAHYDSVPDSPGANDNASGVAALLALARAFANRPQPRTLRFVAFVNEEVPFFLTTDMGSHAYARASHEKGERIIAMLSLEGLGYYSDEPGSQYFPLSGLNLIYPGTGNFIAFVTRIRDGGLLRRTVAAFREQATIPSEGAALPESLPGVTWSDHWAFWQHGYPALMVTDTLPFRDPQYHQSQDTPERLDYERMARVVGGLEAVVTKLQSGHVD